VTIFANKTKLFIALLDKKPLAAILCYYQPTICYLSKLPSYEKAREYDTNTLLAAEAIRNACENGYKYCDLGATELPTQTRWKEQYKGIKIPLKIYEKKYSKIRSVIEKFSPEITWFWTNKRYILKNPQVLISSVVKRRKGF
jgi:lipid II:glycine glycyltransferase (peptidoglycan interpeptide bridge formation enzyme)